MEIPIYTIHYTCESCKKFSVCFLSGKKNRIVCTCGKVSELIEIL